MTLEQLIAEGERLACPSLLLTDEPNDDGIVAYWGGSGPVDALPGHARGAKHWLTIGCSWLADLNLRVQGSLSVFERMSPGDRGSGGNDSSNGSGRSGIAVYDPGSTIDQLALDGQPLYGVPTLSFPPLPAVCLYGGMDVEDWLRSIGLTRYDYHHAFFSELGRNYEKEWLGRSPWLAGQYYGIMGGWHVLWPDDDFYMPPEMNLLVWTFRDSEPWVEVWERLPNFRVCFRTT